MFNLAARQRVGQGEEISSKKQRGTLRPTADDKKPRVARLKATFATSGNYDRARAAATTGEVGRN